MAQKLTLELPDDLYEPLRARADRTGKTPEQIVIASMEAALREPAEDDLLRLSGALASEHADISDRHDEYLGQALAGEPKDEKRA